MFSGRHTLAIDTEVGRHVRRRRLGRAIVSLSTAVTFLALGQSASAVPVLSLRTINITVNADGVTPTPVNVLAEVVWSGTNRDVNNFGAEFSVSASGTLNANALIFSGSTSTISNPGVFTAGNPQLFGNAGSPSRGFTINQDQSPASTLVSGTTSLATLRFTIPAGIDSGTYTITFLTDLAPGEENPNRAFVYTDESLNDTLYPYANGNNGTTYGVITVVPEPSTGTALATATLLMAGVGIVQRQMRRRDGMSELVA